MERRVTLVCAPAGAGKSTLLAQLALACGGATVVWLSLDEDDSDANRLFASLLATLRDVKLEWEVDPQTLASPVLDAGANSRAAAALLVNALCSFEGERLLIVLDDLHRVADADALQLLNDLIERLPPEVGVAVGTRVMPALSLARWRSRGELGELLMDDLQFGLEDTEAFARARLADAATPELVRQALQRTHGWAAGLQLLLGASLRSAGALAGGASNRHMFDFLMHEVLAELPEELRDFVLRCSVLPELSARLCDAVTQRDDSRRILDELYRRNLFLVVVDEATPVLRFHDLFRDFLQGELERRSPQVVQGLHALAAQAESVPTRAIVHWLKAQRWDEAVALMHDGIEPLLAEGGHALVERWIAQLPASLRGRHDVAHLRGLCAWARWDWPTAARFLEEAGAGYRECGDTAGHARALVMLPRTYNAAGELEAAERLLKELDGEPLDARQRAIVDATRAWQALGRGEPDRVAPLLQSLADRSERDPSVLFPAANDMFNSFFFGLPGTMKPLRRLRELARLLVREQPALWQVEAMAVTAWPELWHGERATADQAIAQQTAMAERFSILKELQLNALQSQAIHAAVSGDFARAVSYGRGVMAVHDALQMPMFSRTWRRISLLTLAGVHWIAEDATGLRALLPSFAPERDRLEWPALDTGRAVIRGRCALLEGNVADAEPALEEACERWQRWRLPAFMIDPRVSLALLRLQQGNRAAAWVAFEPVLQESVAEDSLGPLLFEPRKPIERLLELAPPTLRAAPALQTLIERLSQWRLAHASAAAAGGPLERLSPRELEVLARIAAGDSNKLIARALDLSPHTVKRHVANILDKLAAPTRGAAAALYRQSR